MDNQELKLNNDAFEPESAPSAEQVEKAFEEEVDEIHGIESTSPGGPVAFKYRGRGDNLADNMYSLKP